MFTQSVIRLFYCSSLIVLTIQINGCGIGNDRMLFATNSSVGVDMDAAPTATSIAYSRQNVVLSPQYPNGMVPPVLATSSNSNGTNINKLDKLFNFDNSQNFVTGDAAVLFSAGAASGKDLIDEDTYKELLIKPKDFSNTTSDVAVRGDFVIDGNNYVQRGGSLGLIPAIFWHGIFEGLIYQDDLDDNKVHPYLFGANSSIGLAVAWTPEGAPKSINLGYKRQELAIVKVGETPDTANKENKVVSVPSLLGTFQGGVTVEGTGTELEVGEIFATGRSAELLAASQSGRRNIVGPALFGKETSDQLLNPERLDLKGSVWLDATKQIIPEPSGITSTPLKIGNFPLVACIHDEKSPTVFFMQPLPTSNEDAVFRSAIKLSLNNNDDTQIDDLEYITYESKTNRIYLGSSFRYIKNKAPKSNQKNLMRFTLPTAVNKLLETNELKQDNGLEVIDIWGKFDDYKKQIQIGEGDDNREYLFEVEGLIAQPNKLLLGVLYYGKLNQETNNNAMILEYSWNGDDWNSGKFNGYYLVDLSGHGISDMTLSDDGYIFIASSDSQKIDNWDDESAKDIRSKIWRLDFKDINTVNNGKLLPSKRVGGDVIDKILLDHKAKLEGITFTQDGDLWLAFDGQDHGVIKIKDPILKEL